MSHDRKPWSHARPYCKAPGYVASAKCRLGGWIVLYDRDAPGADISSPERWIVMHQPSTRFVVRGNRKAARALMRAAAEARDLYAADAATIFLVSERIAV